MNALFAEMRRLHERGPMARGLVVDADGVMLGPNCVLIERTKAGYQRIDAAALDRVLKTTFGDGRRFERFSLVLDPIAEALAAGDLVKAQLLGLEIPLGTLDDRQLQRLRTASSLIKAGFDPNQPRDERGQWTAEGGEGSRSDILPVEYVVSPNHPPTSPVEPAHRSPMDMWDITDERKKPVKVVDDNGGEILGPDGKPMWRPKDLDPNMFVDRGLAAAAARRASEQTTDQVRDNSPDTPAIFDPTFAELSRFFTGGPWDAERVDGVPVRQYRDYATVAIGLYGAAAGIPLDEMLRQENEFACVFSRFDFRVEQRDSLYRCLPTRNVENTKRGYELYESGKIAGGQKDEPSK